MFNPLRKKPLRLPGQSLSEKLISVVDDEFAVPIIMIFVTCVVVVITWVFFYWPAFVLPVPATITGALVITFLLFKLRRADNKIKRIKQGRDGERIVGQQLEELRANGCHIFHDIPGEGFNIDHVVIAPQGVFCIETKTWSKRSRSKNEVIRFDGLQLVVNGRHPDKDAIAQSIAEAHWLQQMLKKSTGKEFPVKPVVVFPGWFVDPESSKRMQERGVWLLNPEAFPTYVKNAPVVLSNEELSMASFHLTRYVQAVDR